MSTRAEEFLEEWVDNNIHADAYPQSEEEAKPLANTCRAEAEGFSISPEELETAAGGDLVGYIFRAMENATDAEVARLAAKDD